MEIVFEVETVVGSIKFVLRWIKTSHVILYLNFT